MPREKKSAAEISEVRRKAALKSVEVRKAKAKGRSPMRAITCRPLDYEVVDALAKLRGITIVEALHQLCIGWLKNHPDKKPQGWDEYAAIYPALGASKHV